MTPGKTVLVTGAGGYVGSALVLHLAKVGHRVIGFGHGSRYSALRKRATGAVELVAGDLTDREALGRVMSGVDVVVHSGSVTGETACRRDMGAAVRAIVRGTRLVVDTMLAHGVGALIHISTYGVYSTFREREMPLAENAAVLPDDLYGVLKAEAEWEAARVPSVIARLTNVYGRGSGIILKRDVVGHFVRAVQGGQPVRIFGDGSQGIDFIHVDDVCDVVSRLIALPPARRPSVLNVGSGGVTSIRSLATLFQTTGQDLFGREIAFVQEEAPRDKIWPDRWVAIDLARSLFSGYPAVSLAEGVRELLASSWPAPA